jgi:hypothetical protein
MAERGRRPSHRLVVQHDPDNDKDRTEIGAMWPHGKGGGFSILIKDGVAFVGGTEARLVAYTVDDEDDDDRPRRSSRERGGRRNRSRGRSRSKSRDDDDRPPPHGDDDDRGDGEGPDDDR